MAAVKFLPRAEEDLLALSHHLQDEIFYKVELLAKFPQMGPSLERAYQGYRYLLAGGNRYRIIYKIKSATLVEIVYIRHCRRQMGLRLIPQ